jgi:ElaA protein
MNYTVKCFHFDELSTQELYAMMRVRQEVFIIEQNCNYLDADGQDLLSYHLFVYDEKQRIAAYTRLLPEGVSYEKYTSIGRVLSASFARGLGVGKLLMRESITAIEKIFGTNYPIKIGAQSYLLRFYEELGFKSTGEEYLEDDIPHTKMIRYWN